MHCTGYFMDRISRIVTQRDLICGRTGTHRSLSSILNGVPIPQPIPTPYASSPPGSQSITPSTSASSSRHVSSYAVNCPHSSLISPCLLSFQAGSRPRFRFANTVTYFRSEAATGSWSKLRLGCGPSAYLRPLGCLPLKFIGMRLRLRVFAELAEL